MPRDTTEPPRELRRLAPLDLPMVPFVVAGMVGWALTGLVLLVFRASLLTHGRTEWLRICVAGFLVGLPGLALMIVHDRNRRERRQRPTPPRTGQISEETKKSHR